jgi:hypothetical protein
MTKLSCTLATALAAALATACADLPQDPPSDDNALDVEARRHNDQGVASLPCFDETPSIAAAAATLLPAGTKVRAVYATESGAQIYRCDKNAAGQPVWALRTPLAHLVPSKKTKQKLGATALAYHHRSDFGGLVSAAEIAALGLIDGAGVVTNAPVWSFTFAAEGTPQIVEEREIVAGRVLAQDVLGTGNIPNLLVEVRGRSVAGLADGIVLGASNLADPAEDTLAATSYILRWNLRGGVAPAAGLCSQATLGSESQQAYAADYYFLATP